MTAMRDSGTRVEGEIRVGAEDFKRALQGPRAAHGGQRVQVSGIKGLVVDIYRLVRSWGWISGIEPCPEGNLAGNPDEVDAI